MRTSATRQLGDAICEVEVTLHESVPRIWRRVLMPGTTTLHRLHHILQALMLWQDYHLYEFTVDGVRYGVYEPEFADEQPVRNARRTRLADVAGTVGAAFTYLYDFGDDWHHDLLVTAIKPPDPRQVYPLCIASRPRRLRAVPHVLAENRFGVFPDKGRLRSRHRQRRVGTLQQGPQRLSLARTAQRVFCFRCSPMAVYPAITMAHRYCSVMLFSDVHPEMIAPCALAAARRQ